MSGLEALWTNPAVQTVAWALVHFLWQGALVGLAAAGVHDQPVRRIRRRERDVHPAAGRDAAPGADRQRTGSRRQRRVRPAIRAARHDVGAAVPAALGPNSSVKVLFGSNVNDSKPDQPAEAPEGRRMYGAREGDWRVAALAARRGEGTSIRPAGSAAAEGVGAFISGSRPR